MSLKEKAQSMNSGNGIEFMANKNKGEMMELYDRVCTIMDYDFIHGDDGDYVVFVIDEINDEFFFGGSVLTEDMKKFTDEEKKELQENGLPVKFTQRKSKNKRPYTAVEFYPEETNDDLPF